MKKEITKHAAHLGVTLERLIAILFLPEELDLIYQDPDHCTEHIAARSRWIRLEELVIPEVTTEETALLHLLWLQSIERVVVEGVDPASDAMLLHISLPRKEEVSLLS